MDAPDPPPDAADRDAGFDAVLLRVLQAEDAGRPQTPDAWLAEFPAYRAELLEYFADRAALDGAAGRPAEPMPEFPGYEVVGELGHGGMGVVYEARQLDPPRAVALKALPAARLRTPVERVRFRREARVAARLDHPGIVPIYDIGEAAGVPFYTMKLAPGGPLSRALDRFTTDPRPSASRRMLLGFRSRCRTPRSWAWWTARASPATSPAAARGSVVKRSRARLRGPPGASFMV